MNTAYLDDHGGGCCGAAHLHGFTGDETEKYIKSQLKDLVAVLEENLYYEEGWDEVGDKKYWIIPFYGDCDGPGNNGQLLAEVCLTDRQLEENKSKLAKTLKKCGFKHVARWYNPNSGNICNMFVHHKRCNKPKKWKW